MKRLLFNTGRSTAQRGITQQVLGKNVSGSGNQAIRGGAVSVDVVKRGVKNTAREFGSPTVESSNANQGPLSVSFSGGAPRTRLGRETTVSSVPATLLSHSLLYLARDNPLVKSYPPSNLSVRSGVATGVELAAQDHVAKYVFYGMC